MTGQGGWPMTVFLTPDGEPFYGGTYFPPEDRHGMPAFRRVLRSVAEAYGDRRGRRRARARRPCATIYAGSSRGRAADGAGPRTATTLDRAFDATSRRASSRRMGGFGGAPKFPHAMALDFLLRRWARTERRARAAHRDALVQPDGARRHLRPARRRLPSLRGRRALARAALREDALRQRAARRGSASHLLQATGDAEVAPRDARRRSTGCCAR